jgi:hypothetical protein
MERVNVSLVYGVEVPRGTPAAAFAGNAAVRFVHPHGATYPVVYAASSEHRVAAVLDVDNVTSRVRMEASAFAGIVSDACIAAGIGVAPSVCGWLVVCDVR